MKSPDEIARLKIEWLEDSNWDLEDTEGFEDHKSELLIFRLETELKSAREEIRKHEAVRQHLRDWLR